MVVIAGSARQPSQPGTGGTYRRSGIDRPLDRYHHSRRAGSFVELCAARWQALATDGHMPAVRARQCVFGEGYMGYGLVTSTGADIQTDGCRKETELVSAGIRRAALALVAPRRLVGMALLA